MQALNSTLVCEHEEHIWHIFTTFIVNHCSDFSIPVVLSLCFKYLECIKCLVFGMEKMFHSEASVVIDECYPVVITQVHVSLKEPWRSIWMRSSGLLAWLDEVQKGCTCLLPAKQGSHTTSGLVCKFTCIPVTNFYFTIFLTTVHHIHGEWVMSARDWCQLGVWILSSAHVLWKSQSYH